MTDGLPPDTLPLSPKEFQHLLFYLCRATTNEFLGKEKSSARTLGETEDERRSRISTVNCTDP